MQRIVCAIIAFVGLLPIAGAEETPGPLFDGKSLANWTTLNGDPVPSGWEVVDGVIHLRQQTARAGHIVSRDEYEDFVLTFDWKIAPGGNSGLKYRVRQFGNKTLGCEYQIYDTAGERRPSLPNKLAGSLYDVYAPYRGAKLYPPGTFNRGEDRRPGQASGALAEWPSDRLRRGRQRQLETTNCSQQVQRCARFRRESPRQDHAHRPRQRGLVSESQTNSAHVACLQALLESDTVPLSDAGEGVSGRIALAAYRRDSQE